jgi:hypothetical protein
MYAVVHSQQAVGGVKALTPKRREMADRRAKAPFGLDSRMRPRKTAFNRKEQNARQELRRAERKAYNLGLFSYLHTALRPATGR